MKLNTATSSKDLALEHDGVGRPAKGERAATHARLVTAPSHDPVTTTAFLKALDPSADRFTFQLFHDPKHRKNEGTPPGLKLIQHCSTAQVCALAREWNTPEHGYGLYVAINETDFAGRKRENIVRVRAVFVDADEDLMGVVSRLQGLLPPSAVVRSSAGRAQFYWWVDDFPVEQFEPVQRALIAKLQTDPNVYDLPRVMRLPGTLHLKSEPQLVTMTVGELLLPRVSSRS
jgi:RepB DNA-primase from phage plasmid